MGLFVAGVCHSMRSRGANDDPLGDRILRIRHTVGAIDLASTGVPIVLRASPGDMIITGATGVASRATWSGLALGLL